MRLGEYREMKLDNIPSILPFRVIRFFFKLQAYYTFIKMLFNL